jgi:hypothetical protein
MRLYLPNAKPERLQADLSDLTASREVGEREWATDAVDVLVLDFDTEPTATEQAAIERRLTTDTPVEETLHARVLAAYDQLAAYESLTAPTAAQTVAVVKLLCKVARGLIRLQLRQLDKTD